MRFSDQLITWYKEHKRDLPWRKTSDPYRIWLSEIILQQTRVDQGLSYYNKFVDHYPTVRDLALADQQAVLNLWQGLGYYSRARNMHAAAQFVQQSLNGKFPDNYKDILALKGVGEYTAAAIASFAYNQAHAVVDGNVYRVLSRIFGVEEAIDSTQGKKKFQALANELLNAKNPGTHNQAIMEFGALQCTPKQPKCESCPFRLECYAFKNERIFDLPIKAKKTKVSNRYFNYLVCTYDNQIVLHKRTGKGIWQGLYDFPMVESIQPISEEMLLREVQKTHAKSTRLSVAHVSKEHLHLLSHQKIHAKFYHINLTIDQLQEENLVQIPMKEINNYPVPKLIEKYIKATF